MSDAFTDAARQTERALEQFRKSNAAGQTQRENPPMECIAFHRLSIVQPENCYNCVHRHGYPMYLFGDDNCSSFIRSRPQAPAPYQPRPIGTCPELEDDGKTCRQPLPSCEFQIFSGPPVGTYARCGREAAALAIAEEPVEQPAPLPVDCEWTSPRENCPKCGSHLLVNSQGKRWCSFVECDYGCETLAVEQPDDAEGLK